MDTALYINTSRNMTLNLYFKNILCHPEGWHSKLLTLFFRVLAPVLKNSSFHRNVLSK